MSAIQNAAVLRLRGRAQSASQVAASVIDARESVEAAIRDAASGQLDLAVLNGLRECVSTLTRAARQAEQCRNRLQRKAGRMESAA